jgi:iron(III) transport system substrate-binding protein
LAHAQTPFEQTAKSLAGLSGRERRASIEKEARREGLVRWATSTPVTWAEPVLQGFRKKYSGIKIEFNRVSGRALADRAIREYRAGKHDIDVLGSSAVTFWGIMESGMISPYVSPEVEALPADMKDPKGFWSAPYSNILTVICNRNRVKSPPRDWKEFTAPRWKGDFSIDTERFQWFYALQKIYGDNAAAKLISAYLRNEGQIRRGGTLQSQLVAAGEYSCALAVYLDSVYLLLKAGAPVVYSVPEPVLLSPTIIMMPKFPPHPYAAILLYDFLLSPEGIAYFTRNNALYSSNHDVPTVSEVKALKGGPSYFIEVEETSRHFQKISEKYQSLMKK